jgi:hypothetical protein
VDRKISQKNQEKCMANVQLARALRRFVQISVITLYSMNVLWSDHAEATMQTPVTVVSAASYDAAAIAPESIVAAFGAKLATDTAIATDADANTPGIQLPTVLAGTTVEINGRRAGLLFVSPAQINFVMPAATEPGAANITVRAGDGTNSSGTMQVKSVAPAIFTANSTGSGVPAASLLRFRAG